MDYLWTPWRYQYISKSDDPSECIFCAAAAAGDDSRHLIVHRAQRTFVILNRYPYTNGHMMVVPYQHAPSLEDLPDATLSEMILTARDAARHLRALYRPEGMNVGINLGKSAGAGIASHVHLHILPRWTGDTNFMTVVGETRVMPEELTTTWEKLSQAFAAK